MYIVHLIYLFTYITITIIDKTFPYKSIMAKVSYKFSPKFLFDYITYEFVFHQNLLSILSFIIDILQFFGIDLFYLVLPWHKNLIQPTTSIFCLTH